MDGYGTEHTESAFPKTPELHFQLTSVYFSQPDSN